MDPMHGARLAAPTADDRSGGIKRRYRRPVLVEYGTIAKLTQSVGTQNGDGGQMMMPASP